MSTVSVLSEPVTLDPADTPAVMEALGFPDGSVQAVVLTPRGALGISADYPPTPEEILAGPPAAVPTAPEEATGADH